MLLSISLIIVVVKIGNTNMKHTIKANLNITEIGRINITDMDTLNMIYIANKSTINILWDTLNDFLYISRILNSFFL